MKVLKAPHRWYWAHLGSAIGRAIGEFYRTFHPLATNDDAALSTIVREMGGDPTKLTSPLMRPDIFDRETGALWEIKPEGSEVVGMGEANAYVLALRNASVSAHLGSTAGDESLGASGALNYGIYRVSFNATEAGLITYRATIRPAMSMVPGAAALGAAASSLTNTAPSWLLVR